MKPSRTIVLGAGIVLFLVWMAANFQRVFMDEDGIIRLVLGALFAGIFLFRWKPATAGASTPPAWLIPSFGIAGLVLALGGIVFDVHQFEWLGLILLLYACLRWSLPPSYRRDIGLALFLLYWVHPLPGQVFGRLQLAMQERSIRGAEWLLQCLNVRVWADGFFLRTGFRVFGVPEACSGMRTGVTVLLCTLGVGLLLRLKWYEIAGFMVFGLVQVLALNVVRITAMVMWSARMPAEWGETFLHDTLGIFLLIALLIVQTEMSLWALWRYRTRVIQEGRDQGILEHPEKASPLPQIWRLMMRWFWVGLLVAALIAGVAAAVYKSRPSHRLAMMIDVANDLLVHDPPVAERAINEALRIEPGHRGLLLGKAQALALQGRFADCLAQVEALPAPLSIQESVLKSEALLRLDRAPEAMAVLDALPEGARQIPDVAMIRAEFGALRNDPRAVAENIVVARKSKRLAGRVRALFPYLASRRQWQAIVDADYEDVPYPDVPHAIAAAHAHLRNRPEGLGRVVAAALQQWPKDNRFLLYLMFLAQRDPGGRWEQLFSDGLMQNAAKLDAEQLALYLRYCFRLRRPDLAWLSYACLASLDPRDPALRLIPAEFSDEWFLFRRRQLGLKAENQQEVIDLRPFYFVSRTTLPFKSFWGQVPLAEAMATADPAKIRESYVRLCLEDLKRRGDPESLSPRLQNDYVTALGMAGRFDEAHELLNRLQTRYPDREALLRRESAQLHIRQGEWQAAYEDLRTYCGAVTWPDLEAQLMLADTMIRLNLGICALETAQQTYRRFPGSGQSGGQLSAIWATFGFDEQALFLLRRHPESMRSGLGVRLLYSTGRIREAEALKRSLGIQMDRPPEDRSLRLPPKAEAVVMRRFPPSLAEADMDAEADRMQAEAATCRSPYVRQLMTLSAAWHRARGQGQVSDPAGWLAAGRDDTERAALLHRLAAFLGRQGKYDAAVPILRAAIELMPTSPILWRMLIGVTEGDARTIESARRACPDDGDIWLAALVTGAAGSDDPDWAGKAVQAAVAEGRYHPEVLIRAGEFLLRKGQEAPASVLARHIIATSPDYLPGYVLGMACAIAGGDAAWAMECTAKGAELAEDPAAFYKTEVDLKLLARKADGDLLRSLEFLREKFPEDPQWAEKLGFLYFQQRDMQRALGVLAPSIGKDVRSVGIRSLLLASESARLEGDLARAIGILTAAHQAHPDNVSILNNLIYSLAAEEKDLARARQLLPKLIEMAPDSFAVRDTAALVCLKSGQMEQAREHMDRAISLLSADAYGAIEVRLNEADLLFRMGELEQAKAKLMEIQKVPSRSGLVDARAREILEKIKEAEQKRK